MLIPQLCGDEELSIQNPPQEPPVTKWRRAKNCLQPELLHASHQHLRSRVPTAPRAEGPGPELLPRLRGGLSDISPRSPDQEQKKLCNPGWGPLTVLEPRLHRPAASRSEGLGAAGRPDQSPRSETCRLSGAPGPASNPSHPRPGACGLTAPASFCCPRAHPPAGALRRRPSSPGRLRAPPPRHCAADAEANPLFCFEFPTPPRGWEHVTPRGGIRRCRSSLGKSPA